ncbi:hypothetical protein D3C81_1727950 [compost metagenome]
MAGRDAFPVARTQLGSAGHQLTGQVQVFQGHVTDDIGAAVAEHLFGTGVEGVDHAAQVGGDDCHLRRRIEHAAQLTVGAAQFLFAGVQLLRAQFDHAQGALTLTDQHVEQGAEQQTEQAAQNDHATDRRMIGLREGVARQDIDLIVVIGHAQ